MRETPASKRAPIAVAETAMWLCTIDEIHAAANDGYTVVRNADPDGCVVQGLRWARNHSVHAIVDATEWSFTPGVPLDRFVLGESVLEGWAVRWAAAAEVVRRTEAVTDPRTDLRRRLIYEQHLAGHDVRDALDAAIQSLERWGQRPETPRRHPWRP